jgi:chorismate lyase/3-hydroxybenzoate synthase
MFRARQPDFSPAAVLTAQYIPVSASHSLDRDRVLAVIDYHALNRARGDFPVIRVRVPQFNEEPLLETWFAAGAVERGESDGVRYAASGDVLMGYVESEAVLLETPTYNAMSSILGVLRRKGYPHLLRVWNYFPGINEDDMRLERYKRFCVGRHRAFFEDDPGFTRSLPAASAVGSKAGHLLIYFLASKTAGIPQENPRQIAAYRYPPRYSPKSPAFARATLTKLDGTATLFISGTASIVGHETVHADDVARQLEETLANIDSLIAATCAREGVDLDRSDLRLLKVYLRRAEHYGLVREKLRYELGERFPVLYLQADICRADLLLEIEGIAATENA